MPGIGRKSLPYRYFEFRQDADDIAPQTDRREFDKLAGYNLPVQAENFYSIDENEVKSITHRVIHIMVWNPSPELVSELLKEGFNETSK